jgi:hypothetical protein
MKACTTEAEQLRSWMEYELENIRTSLPSSDSSIMWQQAVNTAAGRLREELTPWLSSYKGEIHKLQALGPSEQAEITSDSDEKEVKGMRSQLSILHDRMRTLEFRTATLEEAAAAWHPSRNDEQIAKQHAQIRSLAKQIGSLGELPSRFDDIRFSFGEVTQELAALSKAIHGTQRNSDLIGHRVDSLVTVVDELHIRVEDSNSACMDALGRSLKGKGKESAVAFGGAATANKSPEELQVGDSIRLLASPTGGANDNQVDAVVMPPTAAQGKFDLRVKVQGSGEQLVLHRERGALGQPRLEGSPHALVSAEVLHQSCQKVQMDVQTWLDQLRSDLLGALRSKADRREVETLSAKVHVSVARPPSAPSTRPRPARPQSGPTRPHTAPHRPLRQLVTTTDVDVLKAADVYDVIPTLHASPNWTPVR